MSVLECFFTAKLTYLLAGYLVNNFIGYSELLAINITDIINCMFGNVSNLYKILTFKQKKTNRGLFFENF